MKIQRCKIMMKLIVLYMVVLNMVITTAAVTTDNRILWSSVLVGAALAASVSGSYEFSVNDLALLTTAVLVVNFPRNQPATQAKTCTAPGYTADALLGCYRVEAGTTFLTHSQANQQCASDGGRLLLINSEAEANAVAAIIRTFPPPGVPYWFIQGSRAGVTSPWVRDDGSPLPYLPSTVQNQNVPGVTVLSLTTQSGGFRYEGLGATTTTAQFVCEI